MNTIEHTVTQANVAQAIKIIDDLEPGSKKPLLIEEAQIPALLEILSVTLPEIIEGYDFHIDNRVNFIPDADSILTALVISRQLAT